MMSQNVNVRKAKQLGMPVGTASNQLRKMVLFDLLKRHGENVCFRCGQEIETPDDLSIDHKTPWLDNDASLFWDLSNVAFSHSKCNYSAAKKIKKGPIPHGTHSGYSYRGCRCDSCTQAQREYQEKLQATSSRKALIAAGQLELIGIRPPLPNLS